MLLLLLFYSPSLSPSEACSCRLASLLPLSAPRTRHQLLPQYPAFILKCALLHCLFSPLDSFSPSVPPANTHNFVLHLSFCPPLPFRCRGVHTSIPCYLELFPTSARCFSLPFSPLLSIAISVFSICSFPAASPLLCSVTLVPSRPAVGAFHPLLWHLRPSPHILTTKLSAHKPQPQPEKCPEPRQVLYGNPRTQGYPPKQPHFPHPRVGPGSDVAVRQALVHDCLRAVYVCVVCVGWRRRACVGWVYESFEGRGASSWVRRKNRGEGERGEMAGRAYERDAVSFFCCLQFSFLRPFALTFSLVWSSRDVDHVCTPKDELGVYQSGCGCGASRLLMAFSSLPTPPYPFPMVTFKVCANSPYTPAFRSAQIPSWAGLAGLRRPYSSSSTLSSTALGILASTGISCYRRTRTSQPKPLPLLVYSCHLVLALSLSSVSLFSIPFPLPLSLTSCSASSPVCVCAGRVLCVGTSICVTIVLAMTGLRD